MKRAFPFPLCMWLLIIVLTAGWSLGGAGAADERLVLDPGGVSMDFTGCGVTGVAGPDLLRNGSMEALDPVGKLADWEPDWYVWLATPDAARQAEITTRVKPLLQWGLQDKGAFAGQRAARLAIPQPAYNPADPAGHEFCAMYHQRVALPPLASPTRYLLSYQHRGWCGKEMPNCRAYTRITFYDNEDPAKATQTRGYTQVLFQPTPEWRRGELAAAAPQNTRCLDVRIAITGVGEVVFDEVALHQAQEQDTGLSARLMPAAMLDNRYCLSSGDMLTMIFGFRNGDDRKLEQPQLVVQLPAFVEVAETAPALKCEQKAAGGLIEYRYDLTPIKGGIQGSEFAYPWHQWGGLCLFVRTARPPGEGLHQAAYRMEDGAYRSPPRKFDLQVVPPLAAVAGPKEFRSGAHPFLIWSASKPEVVQGLGRTFARVGFNCVHASPSALGDELGRLGLERFTQPFANGYSMGGGAGSKPESAVFRDIEGNPVWEAICPTEVYRRGAYFQKAIVDETLRPMLVKERHADQLMCNWEPYMYVGRGCYCDRCKEEFKAFSKLPGAEVDALWPKSVAEKHGEVLRGFRRWQHAQFVGTLEATMQALGKEAGREMHFIPELHYALLTAAWEKSGDAQEFATVDYLDKLPAFNAWGPYNWYVFGQGPYEYVRGLHLSCHTTATQVREFLQSRLPTDKQPRLYAFPYGTFEGATEPESIGFELMTYFLDGYQGAIVYLYPGGYDARHWRAIGEANAQIARFEPFVMHGQRVQGHEVEPVTPVPPPDPRFLESGCMMPSEVARWQKAPLVQSWEFERDGRRLFAVGNFWERGECFFRLKVKAPPGEYVLGEPAAGRCFSAGSTGVLSEADLAAGVLLHVGALRYAFFVLEPLRVAGQYGQVIRPQQMEAAMQERLPAIRKATGGG